MVRGIYRGIALEHKGQGKSRPSYDRAQRLYFLPAGPLPHRAPPLGPTFFPAFLELLLELGVGKILQLLAERGVRTLSSMPVDRPGHDGFCTSCITQVLDAIALISRGAGSAAFRACSRTGYWRRSSSLASDAASLACGESGRSDGQRARPLPCRSRGSCLARALTRLQTAHPAWPRRARVPWGARTQAGWPAPPASDSSLRIRGLPAGKRQNSLVFRVMTIAELAIATLRVFAQRVEPRAAPAPCLSYTASTAQLQRAARRAGRRRAKASSSRRWCTPLRSPAPHSFHLALRFERSSLI